MAEYEYPEDREETTSLGINLRLPVYQRVERLRAEVESDIKGTQKGDIHIDARAGGLPRARVVEAILDAFFAEDMDHEKLIANALKKSQAMMDEKRPYQYNPSIQMKRFQSDKHGLEFEELQGGVELEGRND